MDVEEYSPLDIDLNTGLSTLVDDLEREVLHVTLNVLVVELPADHALDVEDGPERVGCELILSCELVSARFFLTCNVLRTGITDKTLVVVPGDIRRCDTVTLVVDKDLDLAALHDTDTGVGGSEIDTDDWIKVSGCAHALQISDEVVPGPVTCESFMAACS